MDILKERIKDYLEENKDQKFIDVDKMTISLHSRYPDYRRKKVKVFKVNVEEAFRQLKDALVKKKGSKREHNRKDEVQQNKDQIGQKSEQILIDVGNLEEVPVKTSMNSRLSNMYTNNQTDTDKESIDCEVIEVDSVEDDISSIQCSTSTDKDVITLGELNEKIIVEPLTGFEKTKTPVNKTSCPDKVRNEITSKDLPCNMNNKSKDSSNRGREITIPRRKKVEPNNQIQEIDLMSSVSSSPTTNKESAPLTKTGSLSINRKHVSAISGSSNLVSGTSKRSSLSLDDSVSGVRKKLKKTLLEVDDKIPNTTFSDFGGNDSVLISVTLLLIHLRQPELYRRLGVTPPRGFLLHGPPGCGKTLLAHCIAGELQLPFLKVAAPELVSGVSGDSESRIRDLFEQAMASSPCIMFIDEIDSITPKRENAQREMERRIVAQLLSCLDMLSSRPDCMVVVIGATNRPDFLDPALRRAGRFDREIALGIPDQRARQKILEVLVKDLRMEPGTDLGWLSLITPGYVGADLTSLVREAAMAAVNRVFKDKMGGVENLTSLLCWIRRSEPMEELHLAELYVQKMDWEEAVKVVQPSAKREGFATVPGVDWSDVGALTEVREELQLAILAPVRHREQFSSLGLSNSSGVLLVGPPGCGKTLVAKAIANEAGINFISVKGPELINMYVGESERAVRAVFQRAQNSSPCVIFFDELDSLCPRRSNSGSDGGSSSRVVNQLLTEMDGVEGRDGVWVMAATNRPDILDPAVMRPGRLDKTLYIGFPGPEDRVEILTALTKGGTRPKLGSEVRLESLGKDPRCEGFSGADVGNLVREASMSALRDCLKNGVKTGNIIVVEKEHFERAFTMVKPSVSEKERAKYESMRRKYQTRTKLDIELVNDQPSEISPSLNEQLTGETSIFHPDSASVTSPMELLETCPVIEDMETDDGSFGDKLFKSSQVLTQVNNDGVIPMDMDVKLPNQVTSSKYSGNNLPGLSNKCLNKTEDTIIVKGVTNEVKECDNSREDEDNSIDLYLNISENGDVGVTTEEITIGVKDHLNSGDKSADKSEDTNVFTDITYSDVSTDELVIKDTDLDTKDEMTDKGVDEMTKKDTDLTTYEMFNKEDDLTAKEMASKDTDLTSDEMKNKYADLTKDLMTNNETDLTTDERTNNDADLPKDDISIKEADFTTVAVEMINKDADHTEDKLRLRFLPDMVVRVRDLCNVKETAGKTGKVLSAGLGNLINVVLDGVSSHCTVDMCDLEPMIPEEGDRVKCLIGEPCEGGEVGELISFDEEDNAMVQFSDNKGRKINDATQETNLQQLYEFDGHPERSAWLDKLLSFMEDRGTPIRVVPTINKGRPLDLFCLYMYVNNGGGFLECSNVKTWKYIAAQLGIGPSSSGAYSLKHHYAKNLLPFECHFERDGVNPKSIKAQVQAQMKSKRK